MHRKILKSWLSNLNVYDKIKDRVSLENYKKRLKEIKEHFLDLIDVKTAETLAAYSFGYLPITKLSEIKGRKGKIVVEGYVEKILAVRRFEKNGKEGMVASLIIREDSTAKVNLWNDAATLITSGDIVEGSKIRIRGYVRNGEINVRDAADVEVSVELTKVESLLPESKVNLKGRISGIGEIRDFGKFKVAELYLSDDTGRIRIVLWDENVEVYKMADIGEQIVVYNGYVKVGKDGEMEVHVGKNSRVKIGE